MDYRLCIGLRFVKISPVALFETIVYSIGMSIRMRHTKAHRNERRAHHGLLPLSAGICPKCKSMIMPHNVCTNCGTYRGREEIDVLAKLTKKERKQKEKELTETEASDKPQNVPSMEEMSKS
jgi:large subunit ribosomal protein L32